MKKTERIVARVTRQDAEMLRAIARRRAMTKSAFLRQAIRQAYQETKK